MAGMLYCAKSSSFQDSPVALSILISLFILVTPLCHQVTLGCLLSPRKRCSFSSGAGGGWCTDLMLGASNFQNADRLCPEFILLLRQPPDPRPGLSSPCSLQPTWGVWGLGSGSEDPWRGGGLCPSPLSVSCPLGLFPGFP